MIGGRSPWVAPLAAVFLVLLIIFLRIKHWAEESMALGIVGLVIFSIFLIWAWITAPVGPKTVPPTGNAVVLAGSLITML